MGDGITCAFTGILKGSGKQGVGGPIVVFSYFAVGVPVSYVLSFVFDLGVFGLCVGTAVGTIVHMLLYLTVVLRIDWRAEVRLVDDRLKRQRAGIRDGFSLLDSYNSALEGLGLAAHKPRRTLQAPEPHQAEEDNIAKKLYRRVASSLGVSTKPSRHEVLQQHTYTDSFGDASIDREVEESSQMIRAPSTSRPTTARYSDHRY
jgi:hypothetical protein